MPALHDRPEAGDGLGLRNLGGHLDAEHRQGVPVHGREGGAGGVTLDCCQYELTQSAVPSEKTESRTAQRGLQPCAPDSRRWFAANMATHPPALNRRPAIPTF